MNDTGRTIDGNPIDDAQIVQWAAEAEAGYDVQELVKRGRPRMGSDIAKVVPVRLDPELNAALDLRAVQDSTSRSAVVREALRAWLRGA
ncbi:ribbon-helix-helix protein, CopG family [Plantibacter sp. Mn2098]|uniref:ribbon-helix-helix protein, CopG family n=1 Tax=Plantibacter sp. Mn2098 TaxID=3395266 RepID=UPI003BCC49D9